MADTCHTPTGRPVSMLRTDARTMLGASWLIVLGAFITLGWLASRRAHRATSRGAQHAALGAFVAAEAVIFVPLLYMANPYAPGAIQSAARVTLLGFAGLTTIASSNSLPRSLCCFGMS